jgi:hypothetical protein
VRLTRGSLRGFSEQPGLAISIESIQITLYCQLSSAVPKGSARRGNAPKIAPPFADVALGARQQFAVANLPTDKKVIWKVSGAGCSGAACGTISVDGLYTAPAKAPIPLL